MITGRAARRALLVKLWGRGAAAVWSGRRWQQALMSSLNTTIHKRSVGRRPQGKANKCLFHSNLTPVRGIEQERKIIYFTANIETTCTSAPKAIFPRPLLPSVCVLQLENIQIACDTFARRRKKVVASFPEQHRGASPKMCITLCAENRAAKQAGTNTNKQ